MKKVFELMPGFIRKLRAEIFLFLSAVIIFAAVFYLYSSDIDAVLYAALLCLALFAAVFFIRFMKFCRLHAKLQTISKNAPVLAYELPETMDTLSSDYSEIISALAAHCSEIENEFQNQRTESIDFYTTWVHQIKTPIAAMNMILQSEDTDENRLLQSELFRIEQYTDMVLQYFRLDSSTNDLVIRSYRADELIRAAIRKYAPLFVRKRISLVCNLSETEIVTDEKWFTLIIEQLLSNAVKYTNAGTVTIECSEGLISISDTGIGMAAEDIPRIFEKGFTGYNGREGKKSTGLGLYLCRKAADKLGLDIRAESEVGKGSTFYIVSGKGTVLTE